MELSLKTYMFCGPEIHKMGYVCKKCREPVKKEATQCKHCGYQHSHGTVWNLIAVFMIWNPIGWSMLSDNKSKQISTWE